MRRMNGYPYRRSLSESVACQSGRQAASDRRPTEGRDFAGVESENLGRAKLLARIDALSFAKVELELYLDAYPDARAALNDYRETLKRLDESVAQYERKYGPLTAASGAMGDRWSWVTGPWPWQYEFGEGK